MTCPALVGDGSTSWARIALSPDGGTLWVSHVGLQIDAYSYPGLTFVGTEITNNPSFPIASNFLAADDAGNIYWARFEFPTGYTIYRHVPGGSSTAIYTTASAIGNELVASWSPYDGLIYVAGDGGLWSLNPSSGARVDLLSGGGGSGSGAAQGQQVPTLDGGIWYQASGSIKRYDIPSVTVATIVHSSSGSASLIPRPTNDVLDGEHTDRLITWDGSALAAETLDCDPFLGPFAVAYTPDLSTVAWATSRFGLVRPSEIWTLSEPTPVTAHWRIGRIGWPT